ncbi:hypothetical protein CDAR_449991 [Caerostris darwini]|uniref:Uncharacterized protein n=1 Tax=Caerostris darwini TaxID=1538125 RepID=A0AAV4QWL1_9ARAC|nr:hypothetical protein CDAR_449991 [Caerostris darwini]
MNTRNVYCKSFNWARGGGFQHPPDDNPGWGFFPNCEKTGVRRPAANAKLKSHSSNLESSSCANFPTTSSYGELE